LRQLQREKLDLARANRQRVKAKAKAEARRLQSKAKTSTFLANRARTVTKNGFAQQIALDALQKSKAGTTKRWHGTSAKNAPQRALPKPRQVIGNPRSKTQRPAVAVRLHLPHLQLLHQQ